MTNDELNGSDDALDMLVRLKQTLSAEADDSIQPTLHSYLLACCEKISHLLPQTIIQLGLDAARRHLMGTSTKTYLVALIGMWKRSAGHWTMTMTMTITITE
ncbi:MAG: hypothetical protein COB37_08810 [Kordiimonadales bacterium]|nr:MAG: hypothetical protein COB37_08810 [Kordiimonadales bacterium]